MPLYQYKCCKCDNVEDRLVTIRDGDKILICSKCGEQSLKKQLSMLTNPPMFKCSGFYETDFKRR